ncbi:hypothetical protein P170DRAFT_435652 [Aspergillus steynii IBT 23096]|uniref:Uncharacterized protein n=1 Tax=Aspergillus steynii IBT 23096 TaxID=1392250 RepID=A0A2I2GC60_9EURO|nr:uncharacterized protein P170DRAFT_435652 [Aspergillus steynii IBT 23096]PLB50462.1 hypothetical protein P170DRAFT_435652 [Aspergillus steynii IBT 23096]
MASTTNVPFIPDYASYNWTGAPSNYEQLATNELGGNSRMLICTQGAYVCNPMETNCGYL